MKKRGRLLWAVVLAALILLSFQTKTTTHSGPSATIQQVHATATSNYPIVGLAHDGTTGYWLASSVGGVFTFGTATYHGSLGGTPVTSPIVGIAPTPTNGGYWLVASDGGIFSFGDAGYYGSTGAIRLNRPIVGMAPSGSGHGYWLVASDGGIFSFGDARFHGSTGAMHLNQPIVGMAATPTGDGYWLVASDGGIFSFGDAQFHGSTGAMRLNQPIVAMAPTPTGGGYWLAAGDGGVFSFRAPFRGSAVSFDAASGGRTVGIAQVGGGYWMPNNLGQVASFGTSIPSSASQPIVNQTTPALPANVMPSASTQPSQSFIDACWVTPNAVACDSAALNDINAARAGEGYGPLTLPSGYGSMGLRQQILAVANAERTSRGLPALPENATLDSYAQAGAQAGAQANGGSGTDPSGPSGYSWGSNIAWGDPTALSADFGWMYDDGPNSQNADCASASAPGCWGHRKNILAPWSGASGAGVYNHNGTMQLTELFVENY